MNILRFIRELISPIQVDLFMTCGMCPEQYDAVINGKQVGYLRLRHGDFTVEAPDCGGKLLFFDEPDGDGFFEEYERDYYLDKASKAIIKWYKEHRDIVDLKDYNILDSIL